MRALVYDRYGTADELRVEEVPTPVAGEGQVLVHVHASSVNSWDWDLLIGNPLIRLGAPKTPQYRILGADLAGVVEAVGPGVSQWRIGDAVMGDLSSHGWGGFAEYVVAPASALIAKPEALRFEHAASIPQAASLALLGLRKYGDVTPGQAVLINGAGGGAGSFAIQLAKRAGAVVTAVDQGGKLAALTALGADRVVDYTRDDYTASGKRYDLILDLVGRRSLLAYRGALTPRGRFVLVGGSTGTLLQVGLLGPATSWLGRKRLGVLVWEPDLDAFRELAALVVNGAITPLIDHVYPLAEGAEALRRTGAGQVTGKVVVVP